MTIGGLGWRRQLVSLRLLLLLLLLVLQVLIGMIPVHAGTNNHRYKKGEHVELWVNKVGPYANPQEAYEYYTLPYCAPETKHHPKAEATTNRFNAYAFQSIGEHLSGHSLRHSGHDITFDFQSKTETCTTSPITEREAMQFRTAIQHRWFYQMYLDDLPVWGMVGELLPPSSAVGNNPDGSNGGTASLTIKEKDDLQRLEHVSDVAEIGNYIPYVYTTRNIIIHYNNDQIVQVDLTSDPNKLQKVAPGATYKFELHIQWEKTDQEFHSRFERYLDHEFFKHPIHWFSVFNSFMLVLFLIGLVALILLRTLRKDYARFGGLGDMEEGGSGGERDSLLMDVDNDKTAKGQFGGAHGGSNNNNPDEAGWKQVHGDVFRAPIFLPLFAALIGTGWQLTVLSLSVIMFAVLGPLHGEVHEERGEVLHSVIICYALSSIVAGYSSGQFFKMYYPTTAAARRLGAEKTSLWQTVMGLTVLILPTFTVIIVSALNIVSLFYGTINTIPFLVIIKLFLIWVCISIPLTVTGTMLGRHGATAIKKNGASSGTTSNITAAGPLDYFPCRVNAIPRPIPEDVPWYGKPMGLIPLAGLLSFGSIFIELYYVLTSLWNYKYYHVYGFLLGVFGILVTVVSMTSIIVVYFCLNAENYHWQWTAFGSGASTAAYVFLYGIYYFLFKTHMNGFLQTTFYFGYMTMIATSLGILCGTIAHGASSRFVRMIFQNVKVD